jgi:hypothetical protein
MSRFFIILFTLLYHLAYSQTYIVEATPTLSFLYNNKLDISHISNTQDLFLFPLVVGKDQAVFKIIRNTKGLFALVDGTGQVYKAMNLENEKIAFTRIDSTKFFGNNFESISFSFNDVLINFGGYGFWHMNGHFCYFNKNLEWTIEKVNHEFRIVNRLFSYNPSNAKIYYVQFPRIEEQTIEIDTKTTIVEFDIVKRENKILGELDAKHNLTWKNFYINIPSLNGVLTYNTGEVYLYRFADNEILKLKNIDKKRKLISKAGANIVTTFEHNGILYYSYKNDKQLRSFILSRDDFEKKSLPIYSKDNSFSKYYIGIIIILIISILFIIKKRKTNVRNEIQNNQETNLQNNSDLSSNEFNDLEKSIINSLIEKSLNSSYISVDEINLYLGIKKKTIEIQKRVRTEAINRINHKFNIKFNHDTIFIERIRSQEDRRYFNYRISKDNADIYLKNIQ